MSAKSSKGISITMTGATGAASSYVEEAITALPKAAAVDATVAGGTGVAGDIVQFIGTGYPELDGKYFILDKTTSATDIKLEGGPDLTGSVGTFSPSNAKARIFASAKATALCLSSLAINADTPGTIAAGTYCDPTATLPNPATSAGTLSFGGYVDTTAKDYGALLAAELDGLPRVIRIALPGNGSIVAPVTIASMTWELPLDGAISFSGTATLGSKPRHLFTPAP